MKNFTSTNFDWVEQKMEGEGMPKVKDMSVEEVIAQLDNAIKAIKMVRTLVVDAICTDGAHHKQWYLEEIAKALGLDLPEHDPGIAP